MIALLDRIRTDLFHAFQPIVNVHTGEAFGYEALLRGFERVGWASIPDAFAAIDAAGVTLDAELLLLDAAVSRFVAFAGGTPTRLFFNLNNRVFDESPDHPDVVRQLLHGRGLPYGNFCLELSETSALSVAHARRLLRWQDRPLIALDDFGIGFSGLRLVSESKPDIVKIDRFLITGVDLTQDKQTLLGQIVQLAHAVGLLVVAEGVETEGEFRACRDLGCDFVQGFFIARPSAETSDLVPHYGIVAEINRRNRRARLDQPAGAELRGRLDPVAPLLNTSPMESVLDAFRADRTRTYFPVVNAQREPLGIVHEERLKALIYSQFGRDLLINRVQPHRITDYLSPCLTFDVSTNIDRILSVVAARPNDHAILIAEAGAYLGLIDTRRLISTMHDRMLAMARDENPLTKLPGNVMVANAMAEAIESDVRPFVFAHFDFDYFKPFNDRFGFRVGDRAITLFADLLRSRLGERDAMLGHIGGDDFFVGASGPSVDAVVAELPGLIERFRSDVATFYDPATRRSGMVEVTERSGAKRLAPLLGVSCACVVVSPEANDVTLDGISAMLARLKGVAKRSPEKFACEVLGAPVTV
jgi:diguanylate cyclase (GGDEF)-like protein